MNNFLLFLRSLIFNIFFFGWTISLSILCLPLIFFLSPKTLANSVGRIWASVSLFLLRIICGITHEVKGAKNIPSHPCIIASKHQSAWETMIFYKLVDFPVFILKKELTKLPLYGEYLKAMDSIAIDRDAGAKALVSMVNDTKDRLAKGRTVIIFPEGTRVKAGEKGIYQSGISALYSRCEIEVVPVALNSGKFWGKNSFIKRPGKITIEFLPAIEPGLRRDQFMEILEKTIEDKSQILFEKG